MHITFFGVRGSTPCSCTGNRRYGGNTSCVAIEQPGSEPIVLDLGTGLRFFGETQPLDGSFRGHALVTHLHWDHVQGLPFFPPINREGARLTIHGPPQEQGSLADAFDGFMAPPYFPVGVSDLAGDIAFNELTFGKHRIGDAEVTVRAVPHIGLTNGYRIDMGGRSVAYVSDHQQPLDGSFGIDDGVLELCDGVDLLIHDAQYTPEEFAAKPHWGHCTVDYALHVAAEAGAKRLALFHHDPEHDDDRMDRIVANARRSCVGSGLVEVFAAQEGLTVSLDAAGAAVPPIR